MTSPKAIFWEQLPAEVMEQKRDIKTLAKSSVKPYMDSDFGGPFKEGVTVVEHLRALDLEGDSFFLAVPAAQTCHTRIAAGMGFATHAGNISQSTKLVGV